MTTTLQPHAAPISDRIDAIRNNSPAARTEHDAWSQLTLREREILSLMAQGLSNPGLCQQLFVSDKTVETHIRAIFIKLGLRPGDARDRRVTAVLWYLRRTRGGELRPV